MNCDLCHKPVEPMQGLFGGRGNGDRYGPRPGELRHYSCHVDKFGKATLSLSRALISSHTGRQLRELREPAAPPAPAVKRPPAGNKGSNYNRSENAGREWRGTGRVISEMGRRRIEIECPFCLSRFWAFVWSLAGGGKRCGNCGAKHASFGVAYPPVGNEDM